MAEERELDPELVPLLEAIEEADLPPMSEVTPETARTRLSGRLGASDGPEVGNVDDFTIPGPDGNDLPIRVYHPTNDGPHPVLVWFHGGGYVLGSIEDTDPTCRAVCEASDAIVVSVEYRLAPEHPFPTGLRDCYAATAWADRNAEAIGGLDGGVAVGGTSAGATLSAGVSLMARDFAQVGEEGVPDIGFQWLVYPAANVRETFDSYRENGEGYFLERETSRWFRDQYYERPMDRFHPYAAPLEARDVSGLPPATVVTAEFDPLRDEGRAHAERLRGAGVEVTHRHYDGMIHGFFGMLRLTASADCIEAVSEDFREAMVRDRG